MKFAGAFAKCEFCGGFFTHQGIMQHIKAMHPKEINKEVKQ